MGWFSDYHEWLEIADAALPQNLAGYLLQLSLSPLRADPFTLLPYDDPKEQAKCGNIKGFLGELPEREGERPELYKWMAPHRQITQRSGDDMHQALQQEIDSIVARYPTHVEVGKSVLEKAGDALHLASSVASPHAIATANKREIVHVHQSAGAGDYSLHMVLSPDDCKEVIMRKWGERMTLAGSLVPQEYLIVYTPRTQQEVEIVGRIVDAAVRFMIGLSEDGN